MAVSRPESIDPAPDPKDQGLRISEAIPIAASNLEQSTQFQIINDTPPALPFMSRHLSQYAPLETRINIGGTHSITEYQKKHPSKNKTLFFKKHTSKRMAEIEACNFGFVQLLAPNKSPKAVSIVDPNDCYQYVGIMMEKIPFVPYAKRRLCKENLALPQILQKELLDSQSSLLGGMEKLKKIYEEKRNPPIQKASSSSWLSSFSSAVSSVTTFTSDYYNSYYSMTSAGLTSIFNKYLVSKQLTENDISNIPEIILQRKLYLHGLNRPVEETQQEMAVLTQIEETLKTIKALQNKKVPISIIKQLENIHTQCNKIAPPDHLVYNIGGHITRGIINHKRAEFDSSENSDFLANIKLDQEKLSTITQKNIEDIDALIKNLREYRKNRSINTAISETLNKQELQDKQLPILSISFDNNGKPTYSIKQPDSTMDLVSVLEKAKNEGKLAEHIYKEILSNLMDGNKLLTCAVLATFCPILIKTEIKAATADQPDFILDHQDIDNYAIKKGLAECLVINMLLKENDLHGGNFDIYGNLLDPDMKMWDIAYKYKLQDENFLNSSLRTPNANSFTISKETIVNLPYAHEDGYYFWPTKSHSLRSTVKMVAGTTSQANEFTLEDNQLFGQLATDPIFIFHKFKTLAKFTLMDPSLFKEVVKNNINAKPDNGELLDEMSKSIVSRIEELKSVLNNTPEYQNFMGEYGQYALSLIAKDLKEQKTIFDNKLQRANKKGNESKINYFTAMLQGVETSLENVANQKKLLSGNKQSSSIPILQTSTISESDAYGRMFGPISPLTSSPSQKGLFGSSNSLPIPSPQSLSKSASPFVREH